MNASRWPQQVAIGVNRDGQSAAPPSGESLNGVPTLTSRSAPSHYESQQAQPLDQQSIGLMVEEAVIEARNISKHYGATIALDNATLRVFPGEIVGLVGENGAGKSTLVRIIGGAERPDNGEIRLAGAHCEWRDAADALRHGVAVVHQEPQIYPKLSVLENLMLATLPSKWLLAVDRTRLRAEGRNLLGMFALSEDLLDVRMGELSTATQELLVIARAFRGMPRLLVLDEPTAILSGQESEKLWRGLQALRAESPRSAVLYISHRLQELKTLVSRAVVMRNGRVVGEVPSSDLSEARLSAMMTGTSESPTKGRGQGVRAPAGDGTPVLEARGLTLPGSFERVDLTLRRGWVTGLYGLVGSGRTELALSLYGALRAESGSVTLEGHQVSLKSPADAIRHGIAYLSEDRKAAGVFGGMSVLFNAIAPVQNRFSRLGMAGEGQERRIVAPIIKSLRVKLSHVDAPMRSLSGGNQQKVLMARWVAAGSKVLLLDEPTHGVDVGAKQDLQSLIRRWADTGSAVLVITSEIEELMQISDVVCVMRAGRLVLVQDVLRTSAGAVLNAALGYASPDDAPREG